MEHKLVEDLIDGIKVTFPDGHVTTITTDGKHCTCGDPGLCQHVKAALPAWTVRKYQLAHQNRDIWGPTMYRRIGLNPADYGVM